MKGKPIWNERWAYLKRQVSLSEMKCDPIFLSETKGEWIWNEMWSYFKRKVSLFRTQSEPIWNERQAYLKRKVSLSEMKCETLSGRWVALNLLVKRILLREFFPLIFTKSEYTKLYMIRKKFVAVFYVNIYYRIMLLD